MASQRKNISGTITTGNTAQVLATANEDRSGILINNHSDISLWISDIGTATASQPSIEIKAGTIFNPVKGSIGPGALSIIGATTGKAWSGREW
jgi:hypothetical protein